MVPTCMLCSEGHICGWWASVASNVLGSGLEGGIRDIALDNCFRVALLIEVDISKCILLYPCLEIPVSGYTSLCVAASLR